MSSDLTPSQSEPLSENAGATPDAADQPAPEPPREGWPGYSGYAPYPGYPPYPALAPAGEMPYPSPYPYPAPGYFPWLFAPPAPRLGTWALVSMILGAVSIAGFQTIPAILAVIFGFIGLNEIKKSPGQIEGRGLAIAGVVLGFVSLGIGLVVVLLYILYFVVILSTLATFPG